MRVLVCGGRAYEHYEHVASVLDTIDAETRIEAVIQGGASGADGCARQWARERKREMSTYLALWGIHGLKAGPIRNQLMIDEGKPDLVVAFPGGKGTADMVRKAHAAGIRVLEK